MYILYSFCIGLHVFHILTLAFQGPAPDDGIRTGPGYIVLLGQSDREPDTALERVQREEEPRVRDRYHQGLLQSISPNECLLHLISPISARIVFTNVC